MPMPGNEFVLRSETANRRIAPSQPFMLSSPLDEGHYMPNRSKRANLSSLADEIRCTKYSNMYHFVTRAIRSDLLGATHEACGAHSFMSWA